MPTTLINWMLILLHTFVVLVAAGHALLYKRDPRAALGWIAVCLLFPFAGPLFYYLFGINRVRTRAKKLDRQSPFRLSSPPPKGTEQVRVGSGGLRIPVRYRDLVRVSNGLTRYPISGGNRIEILHNGEEAYPAMLQAIEEARQFVYLSSYIFLSDNSGRRFIDELARAAGRGVDVRVLIDGIGELYTLPRAGTLLKKREVSVARFLPPRLLPPSLHINLRNHRKILVVDGNAAFVGGMNITDRHLAGDHDNPSRVVDTHFRIVGPVVSQLEQTFLEDWGFATGKRETAKEALPAPVGEALCRTIVEGPNEDFYKLATILLGAVSAARRRVSIMTPYFLPSRELTGALQAAALRGVEVEVVLPSKNNLPFVHWASRNMLWELLQYGIRIYYQPPPFVHTKLFLVDNHYVHIGSANIDPRSLRLNFEIIVEVFHQAFAERLSSHITECIRASNPISLKEVDSRPLPSRIRDALAWLFTPYL